MKMSLFLVILFFFNDTATTEIYTLSLHDALPISGGICTLSVALPLPEMSNTEVRNKIAGALTTDASVVKAARSEEHTSELQSRQYLVCRLLLEKKKKDL